MPKSDNSLLGVMLFGIVITSFGVGSWITANFSRKSYFDYLPSYIDLVEHEDVTKTLSMNSSPLNYQTLNQPCKLPESPSESELCTQWLLVKIAGDTAWLSIAQLLVSILGTAGLIITLVYNKRALDLAHTANEQTFNIGKVQTRCYISIDTIRIQWGGTSGREILIGPDVRNFGQSPALNFNCKASLTYFLMNFGEGLSIPGNKTDQNSLTFNGTISPNSTENFILTGNQFEIQVEDFERITEQSPLIYIITIEATATDVFGEPVFLKKMSFSGMKHQRPKISDDVEVLPRSITGYDFDLTRGVTLSSNTPWNQ